MVAVITNTESTTDTRLIHAQRGGPLGRKETAAGRRARPSFHDIAISAAEKHGVCVRPLVMRTLDRDTGVSDYVAVPCKSTLESQCPTCAKKARLLRIEQCRGGWHLDHEPIQPTNDATQQQTELLETRADLVRSYRAAQAGDELDTIAELRKAINDIDESLRATGMRGKLPPLDLSAERPRKRSTKRRQDAPDLPTRQVRKTTIGREYAGKYRPSMFVTLTCDSYGTIQAGAPVEPWSYDYRHAARDAIHFAALVDRLVQNLRRVVGWDVQYFATVEPQKRAAPHLHMALRGAIPHRVVRQVVAATYHQVWWPNHDELVYDNPDHQPVWDHHARTFVDPDTRRPLTPWDEALQALGDDEMAGPAHVVRFGPQINSKGMLGGTEEAARHIGYLTKYLTKSISEVLEPDTVAQQAHCERLHAELAITPCSARCPVWLRYGIVPKGANAKTVAGHCKGKAHRRSTLGLPGRRVLVSRKWSGKTLPDHRADREEFVRQLLAAAGIDQPARNRDNVLIYRVDPGDRDVPPRDELIMRAVAQRITWRAEYDKALLAAAAPGAQQISATGQKGQQP
jgi:hypothetical protein